MRLFFESGRSLFSAESSPALSNSNWTPLFTHLFHNMKSIPFYSGLGLLALLASCSVYKNAPIDLERGGSRVEAGVRGH